MRPWVWDPTPLDKDTSGTPVLERQSQADSSDSLFSQSSPIGKLRVHRKTHSILKPKAEEVTSASGSQRCLHTAVYLRAQV